jgi:hypothetical protein
VTVNTERQVIACGRTAEILSWGDGQVLKLFYEWVTADWIEHETAAARLVSLTDLPTPKLFGEHILDGRHGLVYERVTGPSLLSQLVTYPWNCVRYAHQFAKLQTAIHRERGEGLRSLGASLNWTIQHLVDLPLNLIKTALDRLDLLPDGQALCHFDFHLDQVLVTTNGLVILDWMTAFAGSPAADVARTKVVMSFGPLPKVSWLIKILAKGLRRIFIRAYLKRYLELNPSVTSAEIEAWYPVVALARLAEKIPGEQSQIEPYIRLAFL